MNQLRFREVTDQNGRPEAPMPQPPRKDLQKLTFTHSLLLSTFLSSIFPIHILLLSILKLITRIFIIFRSPPPMISRPDFLPWISCIIALLAVSMVVAINDNVGFNWGTMTSHPLKPDIVVKMLKANGIKKAKLFDADSWTVGALVGSNIEVMLAIPNNQLGHISSKYDHAKDWVKENVTQYDYDGGVKIRYVAVGNEPFLKSYNGSFMETTFPALKNIQRALNEAGVGNRIKATVPLNADVYESPTDNAVPSAGNFRSDIRRLMTDIVRFLNSNNAPFVVNIYPYLSLYGNDDFPVDYAFFDGVKKPIDDHGTEYTNVFVANFDTLVWSLKKSGVPNMRIVIGEVGWPTDGDVKANATMAQKFYDGFFKMMAKGGGTPVRPKEKFEVYLFGLFDEDQKSVLPGNFERHWGVFTYDGKPKFKLDFTGQGNDKYPVAAQGVEYLPKQWCVINLDAERSKLGSVSDSMSYACSQADCTPLGYGSSCAGLNQMDNISYAFNILFQTNDQDVRACDFNGLGMITKRNPSTHNCSFPVQIISRAERVTASHLVMVVVTTAMVLFM